MKDRASIVLNGETPKTLGITIAMQAIRMAAHRLENLLPDEATKRQREGVHAELARVHNRLGERWNNLQDGQGDWSPMDTD